MTIYTSSKFDVEIERDKIDSKKHYFLKLSQGNLTSLMIGNPDIDKLSGTYEENHFNIIPSVDGTYSKEIISLASQGEYIITMGASMPQLPADWTTQQFETASKKRDKNLENTIKKFKRIPIINKQNSESTTIAYVTIILDNE